MEDVPAFLHCAFVYDKDKISYKGMSFVSLASLASLAKDTKDAIQSKGYTHMHTLDLGATDRVFQQ